LSLTSNGWQSEFLQGRAWENLSLNRLANFSFVFLRLALGASFLSAVADRFGLWGAFGQPNIAWGDFTHFTAYTAKINWFVPQAAVPVLARTATLAELLLGLALILGLYVRFAAVLSGILLLLFAVPMTFALGVKAPLNYSVFSASASAFLLAVCSNLPFSLDAFRRSSN